MKYCELLHWNIRQTAIAADQLLRCVIALLLGLVFASSKGYADETMSAWCYRSRSRWYGRLCELLVNILMYLPERGLYKLPWGHCHRAYESEVLRSQLPRDYAAREPDDR